MIHLALDIVKIPDGETGLAQVVHQDKAERLAELIVTGTTDERLLARELGLTVMTVRRSMRSTRVLSLIRAEVRARATILMPRALASAEIDLQNSDWRARASGREFAMRNQEGGGEGSVDSWDPTHDEDLFERGRQMFERLRVKQLEGGKP